MQYEYAGFMRSILYKPDAAASEGLKGVEFSGEDLARWSTVDEPAHKEWQHIPVQRTRSEGGVVLEGRFGDVRRIDMLDESHPRYWVALSTMRWEDPRLPVDVKKYPVVEITYRCLTERAQPQLAYAFPGGQHYEWLPYTTDWHTVVRKVVHHNFPQRIDAVVLRLFSATRTTESIEIKSIRFREFSHAESEAIRKNQRWLESLPKPPAYPQLAESIPLGVCMDGASSKRLAHMLGLSQREYWSLVMEDLIRHNHNAIAINHIESFTSEEWADLLEQAQANEIKFSVTYDFPIGAPKEEQQAILDAWITPHGESPAILTWNFFDRREETDFEDVMRIKPMFERLALTQPLSIVVRKPSTYPYYAPYFAASGIFHNLAHRPWDVGRIVTAHHHLAGGQQFWMVAPTFVHATDSPEWNTCPETRLMMNLAFANGARGWFAFTYQNDPYWVRGHCQRSLTGPFLAFSDLWSEIGERMKFFDLLTPLFLAVRPEGSLKKWYITGITSETKTTLPDDVGPVGVFRMRGDDFQLVFIVNNDTVGMAGFNLHVPSSALEGLEIYDLSDYLITNEWVPMERKRHLEMFPGQMKVLLIAAPAVCEHWRGIVGQRMVEHDRRRLEVNLRLARSHDLPVADIEALLEDVRQNGDPEEVARIHRARAELVNLLYDSPAISESRSKIIEATAALCGCDGTLCRMMGRGKVDQAKAYADRVIPLARELTRLRIELREGKGSEINRAAGAIAQRTVRLLAEIRSTT